MQSPVRSLAVAANTRSSPRLRIPNNSNSNSNNNNNNQNQNHNQNHNHNTVLSEHSRDRSNNGYSNNSAGGAGGGGGAGGSNKKPRVLLPPANNKRIHDFFSSNKKKPQQQQLQQPKTAPSTGANNNTTNNNNNNNVVAITYNNKTNTINNQAANDQPGTFNNRTKNNKASSAIVAATTSAVATTTAAAAAAAATAAIYAANAATEQWQTKCTKLQQQLQDKDEQLKAVTGNKTILHTALQQALTKTRGELHSFKEATAAKTIRVNSILEETLRWKFESQAKELRATLSSDGNRLGRIVSTRAGMRVIDTWEEGYASKDWQLRKEKWKSKRQTLLERQEQLKQRLMAQQQREQQQQLGIIVVNDDSNADDVSSSPMSQLEIQEAQESIQMHLETLLREEKELLAEEQTLNDEKGAHIRALKRVASEDASRFRNRIKLHDRYVLDCLLGKGGFSEVWKGFDLKELREVAVKIHQLDPRWADSKKENYTKHVSREYEIHRNVRHSRIVSLYDVFEIDNNSFATVLECCKGTDLDTLLKRKKRLPERQARAILLQILTGMQYLSQPSAATTSGSASRQGIIHYDLKPGNILFDEFGDAKITDFGLSKIVDTPDPAESMELTSQGAGTYWYLPPECFVTGEQVRISNKVDVWSIGVIFYQMLYGQRPFGEGKSQDKLLADHTMLNAQEVHLPEKPVISDAGKEFVKQCLMYDQAFRPTIAQLCENSYVLQKGIL